MKEPFASMLAAPRMPAVPKLTRAFAWSLSFLFPALPGSGWATAPLEFDTLGDEKYVEQVVAMADLFDGTFAKVLFGVSNVGPGDKKGGCKFLVVEPTGEVWRASRIVDREKWRYDPKNRKLHIGPCTAFDGNSLVLDAVTDEGSVKITLKSAPKRERVGRFDVGGDFWEVDTLVRWSDCTVEIQRNGDRRLLRGRGYADHPRSKIMPRELAHRWFRFRALNANDPRLVVIRWPRHGSPVGWHDSVRGRTKLRRALLKASRRGGTPAWRARFKGQAGEWRVTTTKLLHRDAPIEAQGSLLGELLGALVGNPVTYTFRAVLVERGTSAMPGTRVLVPRSP